MTKKTNILLLVLLFGLSLMSTTGYACGKSMEKSSCEKKASSANTDSDSCEKDCCKKSNDSKKDQHGCNRKCDHSGCTTSGLQFSLIAENDFEFSNQLLNFSFKTPITYYENNSISDGFTSIWAPPKIK